MQPAGADDQVEVTGGAAVEGDAHASAVVVERANAVSEYRLDTTAKSVVDDGSELAAWDAHVPPVRAAHEQLGVERGDAVSVVADLPDLAQVVAAPYHLGDYAHAVGHVEAGAPEIDEVSAAPKLGGALDERGLVAGALQPIREGRTGDPRADDQDVHLSTA